MPPRRLIVLGCGTSVGVPMIGCDCRVCTGGHPRNSRTRSSVIFQFEAGNLLIDTTPELRIQFLRERIPVAHAVAYTHYHVDHLFGLDDVRTFPHQIGGPLPLYCTDEVEAVIRSAFSYAFETGRGGFLPSLTFERIDHRPFHVLGESVVPIPLEHAHFNVLGFRVGDLAYCTDVSRIPDASWPLLAGLDVLILDALRPTRSHNSHLTVEEAIAIGQRLNVKRLILTHMSHDIDYETLNPSLPQGVELAYDGLTIEF